MEIGIPDNFEELKIFLKQLTMSFVKFNFVISDPGWIPGASVDDIKTAFKLARTVEKTSRFVHSRFDYFRQFLENMQTVHRDIAASKRVYFNGGDTMLEVFFHCPNITSAKLDVAIRMFIGLFNQQRLEKFLTKEFTITATEMAIMDFLECNSPPIDAEDLRSAFFLKEMAEKYPTRSTAVKQHIKEQASNYKIASGSLKLLLRVIGLKTASGDEIIVRNLIIDTVTARMYDRSILSKPFWIAIFKEIDEQTLEQASMQCPSFLDALCGFIIYIGSMMERVVQNGKVVWHGNPNISICPEITYDNLIRMCKLLSKGKTKTLINFKIMEAQKHSECSVWEMIQEDLED